eukprot:m.258223 g.258223  ORF g.258223 m.258223 type:complete len:551 (+) comp19187_c1_seq2:210-1862(+)
MLLPTRALPVALLLLTATTITASDVHVDVLVVGSTPAGVTAAVAAKRTAPDLNVALLSTSPVLYGMVSGGLGCTDRLPSHIVGGLAKEFSSRVRAQYPFQQQHHEYCDPAFEPRVGTKVMDDMLREANVSVFYGFPDVVATTAATASAGASATASTVITHVHTHNASFVARAFVDATYEGDLLAAANVSFAVGREAAAQYDEPNAGRPPYTFPCGYQFDRAVDPRSAQDPGQLLPWVHRADASVPARGADKLVQSYNFRLCFTNGTHNRVEFSQPHDYNTSFFEIVRRYLRAQPPKTIHQLLKLYAVTNVTGGFKVDVNNADIPVSTDYVGRSWAYPTAGAAERQAILQDHERFTRGLIWFFASDPVVPSVVREQLRHYAYCGDEFENNNHFPTQLYVREARRMVGLKILTQHDVAHPNRNLSQSIGLGGYSCDCHPVNMVALCDEGTSNGDSGTCRTAIEGCVGFHPPSSYVIPWPTLLPRPQEAANLVVPVALSSTHVAFDSVRVELTWMTLGHSAGTAAALFIDTPFAFANVTLLQTVLEQQGQVLR